VHQSFWRQDTVNVIELLLFSGVHFIVFTSFILIILVVFLFTCISFSLLAIVFNKLELNGQPTMQLK